MKTTLAIIAGTAFGSPALAHNSFAGHLHPHATSALASSDSALLAIVAIVAAALVGRFVFSKTGGDL